MRVREWFKKYLIPHEGNDHKPHLLRPRTVLFVCLIALVAELGFLLTAMYVVPRSHLFGIIEANALVDETNQARTTDNLGTLTVNSLLTAAAQAKANDMVANDYFAHTSPQGVTPWDWFAKVGYEFSYAGENLAVNFTDSQDVTTAWMNSPEHRANILNGTFTEIGIATAQGTYEGKSAIYVVQEFGTPASAPVAFINSAAAASAPATVSAAVTAPTKTYTSTPSTAGASVATKKATTKTATKIAVTTKPVAAISSGTASVPASVIAVGNIATTSATTPITTTSASAVSATTSVSATVVSASASKLNVFQRLLSDPKALANYFYIALAILFALALILNIFIKFRIQFPRLIFGGMMVIVVAGLCVLLNQNVGLFHAAIL